MKQDKNKQQDVPNQNLYPISNLGKDIKEQDEYNQKMTELIELAKKDPDAFRKAIELRQVKVKIELDYNDIGLMHTLIEEYYQVCKIVNPDNDSLFEDMDRLLEILNIPIKALN